VVNFKKFGYMRNKDMYFNRVLEACDLHDITNLPQFRHN
jgi:hypothetical protein